MIVPPVDQAPSRAYPRMVKLLSVLSVVTALVVVSINQMRTVQEVAELRELVTASVPTMSTRTVQFSEVKQSVSTMQKMADLRWCRQQPFSADSIFAHFCHMIAANAVEEDNLRFTVEGQKQELAQLRTHQKGLESDNKKLRRRVDDLEQVPTPSPTPSPTPTPTTDPTPSPTPGPPVVADWGSNSCPPTTLPITSETDCRDAAMSSGYAWNGAGSIAVVPKGCSLDRGAGDVYYNRHPSGEGNDNYATICRRA